MKLILLKIKNFRPFYGDNEIKFSNGRNNKNVTIFHGYNGSGKTALLNAFIWCLYGETTPDLEEPERLANEKAISEAKPGQKLITQVRLQFEENEKFYEVTRTQSYIRKQIGLELEREDCTLSLQCLKGGQIEPTSSDQNLKQAIINRILPKELFPFFFFNGERVEKLASKEAYSQVEQGIKTLLDVEIYERIAKHLGEDVSKLLSEQLKKLGDDSLQKLITNEEDLNQEINRQEEEFSQIQKNLQSNSQEILELEYRQSTITELAKLTFQRDQLRKEIDQLSQDIQNKNNEISREISENGYLAFGQKVFEEAKIHVEDARTKGELPAKIKPRFVDELIDAEKCICGRPISREDDSYATLTLWKQNTGLAEIEENINKTSLNIEHMQQRRCKFFKNIKLYMQQKEETIKKHKNIQNQLSSIEEQVDSNSKEHEIANQIINKIEKLKENNYKYKFKIEEITKKIQEHQEELKTIKLKIKEQKQQNKDAQILQYQKSVTEKLAQVALDIAEVKKDNVRKDLDQQIKDIWNDAAIKDYTASINEKYELILTKEINGVLQLVHGASTGEKQVLALSFVASLVKKLEQNFKEAQKYPNNNITVGAQHPLIMDSPFGSLEDDYRQKIARWIPNLANQVIIMVSKTQWRDEVENAVKERIGQQYILELHSPKLNTNRTIILNEIEYPYVVQEQDPVEFTRIVAIEKE